MKNKPVSPFKRLDALYTRMVAEYDQCAAPLGFTCSGCPQNCCVSHFQHHTYVEWAYLWRGMMTLDEATRERYLTNARDNVRQVDVILGQGLTPQVMCPLNDDGLCGVYTHRLMICRLHGVAHTLSTPQNPEPQLYPGCFRFREAEEQNPADLQPAPLDRTPLYRELAAIERQFLGQAFGHLPKVNLTLAEMLVEGPPKLPSSLKRKGRSR